MRNPTVEEFVPHLPDWEIFQSGSRIVFVSPCKRVRASLGVEHLEFKTQRRTVYETEWVLRSSMIPGFHGIGNPSVPHFVRKLKELVENAERHERKKAEQKAARERQQREAAKAIRDALRDFGF